MNAARRGGRSRLLCSDQGSETAQRFAGLVVAELRREQSAAMSAGDSGADLASGAYDIDWSKLTARLPVGKDTASALRRGDL